MGGTQKLEPLTDSVLYLLCCLNIKSKAQPSTPPHGGHTKTWPINWFCTPPPLLPQRQSRAQTSPVPHHRGDTKNWTKNWFWTLTSSATSMSKQGSDITSTPPQGWHTKKLNQELILYSYLLCYLNVKAGLRRHQYPTSTSPQRWHKGTLTTN